MLVGFHISSPKRRLPKVNIPEFNAAEVMSEGVFQDGGDAVKAKTGRPLLPPNPALVDERPNLPPTPDNQKIGRPRLSSATPWSDVINAWRNDADDGTHLLLDRQQDLCNAWADVCGWGNPIPTTAATPVPASADTSSIAGAMAQPYVPLIAAKPSMILGIGQAGDDLDNFGNYYLSCPALTW